MGWTAGYRSKKELIDDVLGTHTWSDAPGRNCTLSTVTSTLVGTQHLWAVQERSYDDGTPTTLEINFFLIHGGAYKSMPEISHPYYYTCPLEFFEMVADPGHGATEFRAKCRQAQSKALPIHCPQCATERGVAIPKDCPHAQKAIA
jgi:hypothetical protein